jgi:hypothetical protein
MQTDSDSTRRAEAADRDTRPGAPERRETRETTQGTADRQAAPPITDWASL